MPEHGDNEIIMIAVVTVGLVLIGINLIAMAQWACCPRQPPSPVTAIGSVFVIDPEFALETIPEHVEVPPCDTVVLVSDV